MQYLHIKNLDKYHPGYKDRNMIWCKSYFSMINADPEFEMLDEIDKWRFIAFTMLEIQSRKPVPLDEDYLIRKGMDFKKKKLQQTVISLVNFTQILDSNSVTELVSDRITTSNLAWPREDKIREEKSVVTEHPFAFTEILARYPNRDGSKRAQKSFEASVKTDQDWLDINKALNNYLKSEKVAKGFIKNCSTWFGNWRDFLEVEDVTRQSKLPPRL